MPNQLSQLLTWLNDEIGTTYPLLGTKYEEITGGSMIELTDVDDLLSVLPDTVEVASTRECLSYLLGYERGLEQVREKVINIIGGVL